MARGPRGRGPGWSRTTGLPSFTRALSPPELQDRTAPAMEGLAGTAPAPRGWKPRVHLSTPQPRGSLRGRASNPRRRRATTGRSSAELPRNEYWYRHGVLTPAFRIENPVDYHYPMAARKGEESNSHGEPCRWLSKPCVPMDGPFQGRGTVVPAASPVRFERTTPAFGGQCSVPLSYGEMAPGARVELTTGASHAPVLSLTPPGSVDEAHVCAVATRAGLEPATTGSTIRGSTR